MKWRAPLVKAPNPLCTKFCSYCFSQLADAFEQSLLSELEYHLSHPATLTRIHGGNNHVWASHSTAAADSVLRLQALTDLILVLFTNSNFSVESRYFLLLPESFIFFIICYLCLCCQQRAASLSASTNEACGAFLVIACHDLMSWLPSAGCLYSWQI